MIRYVCGFAFTADMGAVALIEKARPAWQAGHLNGVGGHIEAGETDYEAMRREFGEETGQDIESWKRFCVLTGNGFEVSFFYAAVEQLAVRTVTDESVHVVPVGKVGSRNILPNLHWLIPMARQMENDAASEFHVAEVYGDAP